MVQVKNQALIVSGRKAVNLEFFTNHGMAMSNECKKSWHAKKFVGFAHHKMFHKWSIIM